MFCYSNIIRNFANRMKKILILCTGNSCRSKMAQACLQHIDAGLDVSSAGTHPARCTHPLAIEVMDEIGMPITDLQPHDVWDYVTEERDVVITVCDHARESCPIFLGDSKATVAHQLSGPLFVKRNYGRATCCVPRDKRPYHTVFQ